jgi:hypothetical protein
MPRNPRTAASRFAALALVFLLPLAASTAAAQTCDKTFDSTYDLIQDAIFENKGCTSAACHGAAAAGGLDLTAGVSYENLISQPSQTVPASEIRGLMRVVPGQKDQSLLFLNLAAATLPEQWQAPLRPMPQGLTPLSVGELEAVREWIEQGAPRTGTVPGTGELLDACLPPAKPIEIEPLVPPAPGTGVQVRMPRWQLPANTEDEVCFASYYDVTDQVPEKYRGPNGTFRFNFEKIRQDPLSHHLIVDYYIGDLAPGDPIWGAYTCRGGERDGESCEPTDLEFCGDGLCGTTAKTAVVCNGFGPPTLNLDSRGFAGTQEASSQQTYPPGVYGELPMKGLLIWNSHAFNLTDESGKIEAWLNFEFAEPEDQQTVARGIFDVQGIFSMNVPPFAGQEVCNHHLFPPDTRLFELNSHNHKRGKLFRVFNGRYACDGGPRAGRACAPGEPVAGLADPCGAGTCVALRAAEFGDCDGNGTLGINDLTRCVGIALDTQPLSSCPTADRDGSGGVSVAELITFVREALAGPQLRDPDADLLYTNLVYNDPTVRRFDPPLPFGGAGTSAAARTVTYCSFYDNGMTDPDEVKRQSTSPPTTGGLGGPCAVPSGCTEGRVGQRCSGSGQAERDASCDSSPGAGDGFCDACTLRGGFTTEDEMFILMGGFFIAN